MEEIIKCFRDRADWMWCFKRNLKNEIAHCDKVAVPPVCPWLAVETDDIVRHGAVWHGEGNIRRNMHLRHYHRQISWKIVAKVTVNTRTYRHTHIPQYPVHVFHIKISFNSEEHDGTCESKTQPRFPFERCTAICIEFSSCIRKQLLLTIMRFNFVNFV